MLSPAAPTSERSASAHFCLLLLAHSSGAPEHCPALGFHIPLPRAALRTFCTCLKSSCVCRLSISQFQDPRDAEDAVNGVRGPTMQQRRDAP